MKLILEDITFVIVTYHSDDIIKNCLNSLPKKSKKLSSKIQIILI